MYASPSSLRFEKLSVLGTILFLFGLTGAPAYAETTNCTEVPSLPFTITTQGLWCFKHDLTTGQTSGNAITVTANNVTIDLNGWKLGGQAAGAGTTAVGISSSAVNLTVKNGIVRGFYRGMLLNGRGAVVEGMLIDQNTHGGIQTTGLGVVVRNNQVIDTGNSSLANQFAVGIETDGAGSLVEHNVVSGLTASGTGAEWGIFIGTRSLARNNFVTDSVQPAGTHEGIHVFGSGGTHIDHNTVSNFKNCIIYAAGGGFYTRNTVMNCTTANYTGGTVGPGNAP